MSLWEKFRDKEVALLIGEPWEAMRERSSARITAATPQYFWGDELDFDASFRFIDPQYGFITPLASELSIRFRSGLVESISLSPHTAPLLLDDAVAVLLNLQTQWRNTGWKATDTKSSPPFEDTPEWRARLRDNRGETFYWRAGDKYRIRVSADRFRGDKNSEEELYRITLDLFEAMRK